MPPQAAIESCRRAIFTPPYSQRWRLLHAPIFEPGADRAISSHYWFRYLRHTNAFSCLMLIFWLEDYFFADSFFVAAFFDFLPDFLLSFFAISYCRRFSYFRAAEEGHATEDAVSRSHWSLSSRHAFYGSLRFRHAACRQRLPARAR